MHVDDPLNEEGSAGVLDLGGCLNLGEIVSIHLEGCLFISHVLVNLFRVLSDHLWVAHLQLVREHHALAELSAELDHALLEDF